MVSQLWCDVVPSQAREFIHESWSVFRHPNNTKLFFFNDKSRYVISNDQLNDPYAFDISSDQELLRRALEDIAAQPGAWYDKTRKIFFYSDWYFGNPVPRKFSQ